MLAVRHLRNHKLGVPAGSPRARENAQCTAHRETWEEAGVDVRVGELLWAYPKNDFFLYACYLDEPLRNIDTQDAIEVSDVLWLDPRSIESSDWRFPEQWSQVVEVFREFSMRAVR